MFITCLVDLNWISQSFLSSINSLDANIRCILIAEVSGLIDFLSSAPSSLSQPANSCFAFYSKQKISLPEKIDIVKMRITIKLMTTAMKKKLEEMMMWLMILMRRESTY